MTEQWVQRTSVEYAQAWANLLPRGTAWPRDPSSVLQTVVSGLAEIWGNPVETNAALLLTTESDPRATNILLPDWERAWGLPDVCFSATQTISERELLLVQKMTLLGAQNQAFFIAQAASVGYTINIHEHAPYQCGISRCGDTRELGKVAVNASPSIVQVAASPYGFNFNLTNSGGPTLQQSGSPVYDYSFPSNTIPVASASNGTGGYYVLWAIVGPNAGVASYTVWTTDGSGNYVSAVTSLTAAQVTASYAALTSAITYQNSLYPYQFWEIGQVEIRFWWNVQITALASPTLEGTDIECLIRRYKPAHTEVVFDYSPLIEADFTQGFDSAYLPALVM